mmetsp:Transcript_19752/g.26790  ORF Transcript_19752/g.26790 Transcript_19752/m.26790 type:complete len:204 (+) Transcript_19752:836-1447(+)
MSPLRRFSDRTWRGSIGPRTPAETCLGLGSDPGVGGGAFGHKRVPDRDPRRCVWGRLLAELADDSRYARDHSNHCHRLHDADQVRKSIDCQLPGCDQRRGGNGIGGHTEYSDHQQLRSRACRPLPFHGAARHPVRALHQKRHHNGFGPGLRPVCRALRGRLCVLHRRDPLRAWRDYIFRDHGRHPLCHVWLDWTRGAWCGCSG